MTANPQKPVQLYLNPGEIVVAESPASVTTVLGSCVAVTLFSPRTRFGAICHAVLPSGLEIEPGKYVDQSIRYMLDYLTDKGLDPQECVVKVFGGADMFAQANPARAGRTIGAQNIEAALATLAAAELKPTVVEVGGSLGRKLIFRTHTGEVFIKRVLKEQLKVAELALHQKRKEELAVQRGRSEKQVISGGAGGRSWQKKSK
jgi:chemotaxis protein CheD